MSDLSDISQLPIGPDTRVTLHFSLTLEDGSEVDSNFDGKPATFVIGDGNLLPGFEVALFGLVPGEEGVFNILPEQGFGPHNPSNIQRFSRKDFDAELELAPGLILSFADANRAELPGVVAEVEEDSVLVDFNHPLAGHTITFTVKILDVAPAVTH